MNHYNMGRPPYGNIHGRIRMIEETTTKIIHFAHDNKCDTTNLVNVMDDIDEEISGPRHVTFAPTQRSILKKTAPTLTPFLKKIAPREIEISHHEFDGLKQTTKDQIIFVYDQTMGPNAPQDRRALDSHSRICQALRFLGVGIFEYDKNSLTTPQDLLANWVHEWNKLFFDWYEADPDDTKSLKEQASRRCWGLDELKAITARWMQGKDEDKLLEPGRKLMKIEEKWLKDEQEEKARKLSERQNPVGDERKTRLEEIRREMQETEDEEEVIREDLIQEEARRNTGRKMKLDAETLEMINGIMEAHGAFARRTARLLARVVDVPDFTDCPRLPRSRRLKAPQPVDYPWNTKNRGRK
jgi:hypothetical protein